MTAKDLVQVRGVVVNRRAWHKYQIQETVEAGLVLLGTEVKSLRAGHGSISEAYAAEQNGELWLRSAHIPEYSPAHRSNHEPTRPRKLLLRQREVHKLLGAVQREGMTLVPLKIYFNERGRAKISVGLARGKKLYDKRQDIKARDWERSRARLLKNRG